MSKAISELRQWVMGELWETDLEKEMGHQILRDLAYIEALEGPRWRCSGCGLETGDRSRMDGYHAKQTHKGQALCDGNPVDQHAAAERKFEEAVNE